MPPFSTPRARHRPRARQRDRLPLRILLGVTLGLLLIGGTAPRAEAQRPPETLTVSDTLWEVRLVSGESYVGKVVAVEGETVSLETTAGTRIQFTRAQAVRMRPATGSVHDGSYWAEDPNNTRLFFSPTARTLPSGGGYFGVYELFVPFLAYGVTDRVLIAGGSPFYLALTGEVDIPFYFGPKILLLDRERVSASIGSLTVVVPSEWDDLVSIVYGVGTWGGTDRALSFGAGWGYVDGDFSEKPVVMLGGETRVGRMTKLMTENLFVPGEDGVIASAGLRFFGERLSADAGLAGWIAEDTECCFPIVNFVYNFGAR